MPDKADDLRAALFAAMGEPVPGYRESAIGKVLANIKPDCRADLEARLLKSEKPRKPPPQKDR